MPCPALPGFDQQHDAEEHRQSGQCNEGEPDIDGEHEGGNEDQIHDFQDKVDNAVGQHIGNRVDIVHNPDKDFSLRTVIIIFEGQFLQMLE
ncbi:hypothetical protein D3C75_491460 [compost metagenome]